ncbi:MAG: tyrosine-protein phosphatase [Eubacterium sp.]|nr:tyrosine-protein phosphatase [Eubacterium sp.]
MGKIDFTGIENARDLGGIMTQDGYIVKKKKLIKSGSIFCATDSDIEQLRNKYKVKLIIDLRTDTEREAMPVCIEDIPIIWNPLYMENIQGLAFSKTDREIIENHLKALFIVNNQADDETEYAMEEVRKMVRDVGFDADEYMSYMYQKFINNQIIQKQIKQFFNMLMNKRGGSILWFCTAGKDRSGMLTALLLYALGVSKEDIIRDYLKAAESSQDAVDLILKKLFPDTEPNGLFYREQARKLFSSRECYINAFFDAIEKDYVSVENYLQKAIEIRVDNIVRLKTLYLDDYKEDHTVDF